MSNVSPEMQERIHQLARNLKSLHLCASMEEAQERAKQIILTENGGKKAEPSLSDLMSEQAPEKPVDTLRQEISAVKAQLHEDAAEHASVTLENARSDLAKAKEDVEKLKEFGECVEEAHKADERLEKARYEEPKRAEESALRSVEEPEVKQPEEAVPKEEEPQGERDIGEEIAKLGKELEKAPEKVGGLEVVDVRPREPEKEEKKEIEEEKEEPDADTTVKNL